MMKANVKMKIEIGLWGCNLIAFIIVNLVALRKFHWLSAIIMAVPLLIAIIDTVRKSYVNRKRQPQLILCVFIVLIVWAATVSVADKLATVTSPAKYEMIIGDSDYEFFPNSLPKDAKSKEFHYFPGFWLARSKGYVKFEATEEYLEEYELIHGADVTQVTSTDAWSERHVESSEICKRINERYLNADNCDVYIKAEGFSIQGYAINHNTNEIFIFYDGFD